MRALIVDDSLTVRMDIADALEETGFTCTHARTCAEARARLDEEQVDLVVLDRLLPDGDGLDLLEEVRRSLGTRDLPVMLLSSRRAVEARLHGLTRGADEYVGKPYDRSYVAARARALVARPRSSPTVLVVDDSTTVRHAMEEALVGAGFHVVTAPSAEQALTLLGSLPVDALVVDQQLPGLSGGDLIRRLRLDAAHRQVPCVLLTGASDVAEVEALDAGADAWVRKEEGSDALILRLRAAMRGTVRAGETASLYGPKRILAVDDSATFLERLADELGGEGYDVIRAASGEEALDLLGSVAVDCILLDRVMPGLSGLDVCRRLKQDPKLAEVPVVVLTGHEGQQAMIDSIDAGADDYVAKSAEFAVLRARIRAQLRRRQFEEENRRLQERLLQGRLQAAEARAARDLARARAELLAEVRRANTELAARNQELDAFCDSVSHDLRAPARAVRSFLQLAIEGGEDREELLARALRTSERMLAMVDDLLGLARLSRSEIRWERVDLSALAEEVAHTLAEREPDRRVDWEVEPGLIVTGDRTLLRVALENLVGNAWKFTRLASEPRIRLYRGEHDGSPGFCVEDNGVGFDPARAAELFRPFQRLHPADAFEGTGVGLATVERIIERHGGWISAVGRVGEGATFCFATAASEET